MRLLRTLTWGSAKYWIAAVTVIAASFMFLGDSNRTHAVNPEILPNLSASAPTYASGAKLLVKGGSLSALNTPCVPGDADPTTLCVRVWATGVPSGAGVSAFQVDFTYPDSRITVSAAGGATAWLGSTGRSASCPPIEFTPGHGVFYCSTLDAPPPWGSTGSGIIGTIAIESRNVVGPAVVNFSPAECYNDISLPCTFLVETTGNPGGQLQPMPTTVRSLNLYIAPCADLAGGDGRVTIVDILYVVGRYNTADPGADLDGSGNVLVNDILIAVGEYGMTCAQ